MPFDQSTIQDQTVTRTDAEFRVSWTSSAPPGTVFQIYINRVLAWHGTARTALVPYPSSLLGLQMYFDIGAVLPSEASLDLSSELPPIPGGGRRIHLEWDGGVFESPTIAGFHVYLSPAPGAPVSFAAPFDTLAAYSAGIKSDGWGTGGWGVAGWGAGRSHYKWDSPTLSAGVWAVAVKPFDTAGTEGPAATASVTIVGPPRPPARDSLGRRLTYQFKHLAPGGWGSGGWGVGGWGVAGGWGVDGWGAAGWGVDKGTGAPYVTLNWLASPGY